MFSESTVAFLLNLINGVAIRTKCNEDELIETIAVHHISGRILRIIDNGLSYLFSSSFIEQLRKMFENELAQVRSNIKCTYEIETKGDFLKPSIAIKGYTYLNLSSDCKVIRSGDIDIIPYEVNSFIAVLKKIGYVRTRTPFLHEAGEFNRQGTEIDVHYFFPIYRYDNELRRMEISSDLNNTNFNMPFERIEYSEIEKHIYHGCAFESVYVADANISILIMCAHMFMNYTNIWSISHREKPYVKLGELWDVFEMTSHDSYSADILLNLIEKYKAYDCIKWAGTMLKMVFNNNPLPLDTSNYSINDYPKCLWWNIWRYIPTNIYQLMSTHWYSVDDVFYSIGENRVSNGSYDFADLINANSGIINHCVIHINKRSVQIIYNDHICKERRFRIDFGNSAVEIIITENSNCTVGDTDIIRVQCKNSCIEFDLISNRFIVGVQEEKDGLRGEMLVPFCIER